MTLVRIATVVEGQGEVAAMPVLLRRLAEQINPQLYVESPRPHRVARGTFLRAGGVENAVATLVEQVGPSAGILMVVDADDDCPAKLGPALVERARRTRSDVKSAAVIANREFEAWFLAAAPSLAGRRGLADPLHRPADPEEPRDCKGWLTAHRVDGRAYKPASDQAALAAAFDLAMAREHSPSFDKLWRDLTVLLLN
jgi:hypothetical protein